MMRQYLLPKTYSGEGTLTLSERDSRYLTKVLRYAPGTCFNGIDQSGKVYDLVLIDKQTLGISPAENGKAKQASDTLPSVKGLPRLHLLQCLCKGKKDDSIIRQATEIGVLSITFVQSRFCVSDASNKTIKAMKARNERYEAIIKEAIQQSGSAIPTSLTPEVLGIEEVPEFCKNGLGIFFHQDPLENQQSLGDLLAGQTPNADIYLLVGSEGGFSAEECALLKQGGMLPVLLKTNILRAETAAVYALAACQSLLQEKPSLFV